MAIPKARTGKKTVNVYVGHERFETLLQLAIDVSQESRVQITPLAICAMDDRSTLEAGCARNAARAERNVARAE
ncbi:TPA: hypothetical protein L3880_006086 [Pseudomonas aeruginosa]|nr:hypothetical protein [Pseudomonas aeruginosa]